MLKSDHNSNSIHNDLVVVAVSVAVAVIITR